MLGGFQVYQLVGWWPISLLVCESCAGVEGVGACFCDSVVHACCIPSVGQAETGTTSMGCVKMWGQSTAAEFYHMQLMSAV
jgi:hypothetical protein